MLEKEWLITEIAALNEELVTARGRQKAALTNFINVSLLYNDAVHEVEVLEGCIRGLELEIETRDD
jgi:hypothetical protein